ncbi:MAG: guanylate kinase [Paludibacteraceae bacterium]|nr:guanylate kinase [Paludibacteraceae bacterium]MBR6042743.1 guanylate kinase [Paludibacteraceae bacterium]MCR5568648.1 guanylate kinase [Paludibacteraceae bacterium]
MADNSKIIIFSAPSGSGKSTIINFLLEQMPGVFEFSISATSRQPRGQEVHGREYYFLSPEEFRTRIANGDFLEYEEVYKDRFYGTLKSEVDRISANGRIALFDVDVKGGVNIKKFYGDKAMSVFIQPPSIEVLKKRLEGRGTDAPDVIQTRLERASFELTFAPQFDKVVVNDDLTTAENEVVSLIKNFLDI